MSSEIAGKLGNLGINGQIDMGVRLGARYYIIFLLISMPIDIPLALAEVTGINQVRQLSLSSLVFH